MELTTVAIDSRETATASATLQTTDPGCDPFTVGRITDQSTFGSIRDEWDELLQASDSDCLFLTWEWLATWWKHLGANSSLSIFAVRRAGELIAIAPFRLLPANILSGRLLPVLEFLGSGQAGSDYPDLFIRRGHEAGALDALAREWTANKRELQFSLKWTNLRQEGSLAAQFAARLCGQGWSLDDTRTNISPYIPLTNRSWESYLGDLGAEHRSDFKRKWKRLDRDFTVGFDQVLSDDQCLESIDLLIHHHNLRWSFRGGSDAFHTAQLVEFHREVSRMNLHRGWLRLYTLRLNGQPGAFVYGFLYSGKFYFYQSAFDGAYEKYSVGMLAMGLAIKSAIGEGAEEYDLLHGDETYKSHWSRESRVLCRLELYPRGVQGWLGRRAVTLGRFSRNVGRGVSGALKNARNK